MGLSKLKEKMDKIKEKMLSVPFWLQLFGGNSIILIPYLSAFANLDREYSSVGSISEEVFTQKFAILFALYTIAEGILVYYMITSFEYQGNKNTTTDNKSQDS